MFTVESMQKVLLGRRENEASQKLLYYYHNVVHKQLPKYFLDELCSSALFLILLVL